MAVKVLKMNLDPTLYDPTELNKAFDEFRKEVKIMTQDFYTSILIFIVRTNILI